MWAGDTPQGTVITCPPAQTRLGTPNPRREDPTSGVGGHVSHFLEGIQEGNCGQHRGPEVERPRRDTVSGCRTHWDVPMRRGVPHVPPALMVTHLSWECSLVAFELKSSHMG